MVYQWICKICGEFNIYVETCTNCSHHQSHQIYVTTFEESKK